MDINSKLITEKVSVFVQAYEELRSEIQNGDGTKTFFEKTLDEDYDLVIIESPVVGEIVAITDSAMNAIFYYLEDDEWTIGDLIGGYLDLYFKR